MKILKFKLAIIFAMISLYTYSQNWTGNVNSDWNNQGNWSSWPLSGEDLLIDTLNYIGVKASPLISNPSVFSPDGIVVQNGALLTVNNNLNAFGRIEVIGEGSAIQQNAGTLQAAGSGSSGRFIVSDGAKVVLNNGNISCQQRLIVELGASFIMNGGSVNSLDEIAIGDGNLAGSSLFVMNGGNVVTGGDLAFENELGVFEPTFRMNAGSLIINGDVSWLGILPGQGTPKLLLQGGTSVFNGSILNGAGSTVNLYLGVKDSANFTFNGSSIALVNSADSVVHSGTSSFVINNVNTISNSGVWLGDHSLITFNGNSIIQGNGEYHFHSLKVEAGKSLSQLSPEIQVNGNLINNGNFNPNSGLVVLGGSALQTISGNISLSFYDLRINNSSSGILLNKSADVIHKLELTRGLITTNTQNQISLSDNAIAAGFSDSSFVNGPMVKKGNDAFVFPVGKGNSLATIGMSEPLSMNAEFLSEYFNVGFVDTLSMYAPLSNVSSKEFWYLEQISGTDSITVDLYWNDSAASIESCDDLTIALWDGNSWVNMPSILNGTCSSGNLRSQNVYSANGFLAIGNASLITSIHESSKNEEIIYPNPVASFSSLVVKTQFEMAGIEILNAQGKKVWSIEGKGSKEVYLDNTNLAAGLYLINIISEKGTISKKLIVN